MLKEVFQFFDENKDILLYVNKDFYKDPFLYVNQAVSVKSGYSREELTTEIKPYQLVHPSARQKVYESYLKRVKGEEAPTSFEIPVIDRWGNIKWVFVSVSVVKDRRNGPVVIGIGSEITEKKKMENLIKKVVEAFPYSLVVLNRDLSIEYYNRQTYRWIPGKTGELKGRKCYEVFRGRDTICEDCFVKKVFETGESISFEKKLTEKESPLWLEFEAYPVSTVGNEVERVVIQRKDITDKKLCEQERLKLEKLESMSSVVGAMAHNFNNILATVIGNITLASSLSDPVRLKELLRDAEKQCLAARRLTYFLLSYIQDEEPVLKPQDPRELVGEALSLAEIPFYIRVVEEYEKDLHNILADRDQIIGVFYHIIVNSVEAIEGEGRIEIKARNVKFDGKDFVEIIFRDTGKGIPEADLPKVFDVFYSKKLKGLGLGLTISKSVVEKHGGRITITSSEGAGTEVRILLPAEAKKTELEEEGKLADLKIVVMDDNKAMCDVLKLYLEREGAKVCTAPNGEVVLKLLDELEHVDVFILDMVVTGGMGGMEVARLIKERLPNAKILGISGYYEVSEGVDLKSLGFNGFLRKPFELRELKKAIIKVLREEK